jgi:vancomycin aglycone glucosyltransferase
MKHEDPAITTKIAVKAAHVAGCHAIVSAGWAELGSNLDCADCSTVGDISHADLFRRVAAVVHHGGSGTTATAARAGVPQIIVPHITDQFYWADRIQKLGLGPAAPWRSRMTIDNLARAINEALTDGFAEKTKQVADQLSRTDAVGAAVQLIESPAFLRD